MEPIIRNCLIDEVFFSRKNCRELVHLDCMTDKGATFLVTLAPEASVGRRKNDYSLLSRMLEVYELRLLPPTDNFNFRPIYGQLKHKYFRFKLQPWKREPGERPSASILKMKRIDPFPYPHEEIPDISVEELAAMARIPS